MTNAYHFPLPTPAYTVSFSFLCLFSFTSYLLYLFWSHLSQLGLWFCNFWNKCRCRPCKGETKWYNRRGTQNWGAFLISYLPACLFLSFCSSNAVPGACTRMMHVCMCVCLSKYLCLLGWCSMERCGITVYLLCEEVTAMYIRKLLKNVWGVLYYCSSPILLKPWNIEWI